MKETQFRVLYKQFLFRMVDLELLSADAKGDMSKLFGQFAALLIFLSIGLCLGAGVAGGGLVAEWSGVHFMIATTMLVVGLFAILSWDSTFPDRRDVMVLAPLPIRSRTVFLAKVAAVATALSLTIATLHGLAGVVWPFSLNHYHRAEPAPAITFDSAIAPVDAAGLQSVMDRDLEQALKTGPLAPGTGGGAAIGVWKHGVQRLFAYGAARPDSIFEIGSVSKTFTAVLLGQLATQGKVTLDEPLRELLPPETVVPPSGVEITLRDLATHQAGLPRMPNNLHPASALNPSAGYTTGDAYAFMKYWGVTKAPVAPFAYSHLGFGLLGDALAYRAGRSFADLVRSEITEPLGMRDTVLQLSAEQRERAIAGYAAPQRIADGIDPDAMSGAMGIRSTAGDLLRYLVANLHPETIVNAGTLQAALTTTHELRTNVMPGWRMGLAWFYDSDTGTWFHGGATAGFTSYAFFQPKNDCAAVILTNGNPDAFAVYNVLAEHVRARLSGEPAISLDAVVVPAGGGGISGFIRQFAAWWITMLLSGAFIYCCVLGLQGLVAQLLPRRYFLRASSFLQLAAFGTFVGVYFLEPKLVAPGEIAVGRSSAYLAWSPSYWFLGLFQQLNGSPALAPLARRAWIAIAIAFGATASAYTLAYFRTMRKIVEEPEIAPASGGRSWVPGFGNGFATAVGQFSVRTLLRSRQHRLLLAFYMGVGFAFAIFSRKTDHVSGDAGQVVSVGLLCSTILIMVLSVLGMRIVFSLPTDMRANWIFRFSPIPGGQGCMIARRRALYALSVVPVCLGTAAVLFSVLAWQVAMKHLVALAVLGSVVAEVCLHGRQKLPFTCSYLPGKSNFNISLLLCSLVFFTGMVNAAELERELFDNASGYAALVALLLAFAICARRSATRFAKSPEGQLQFEEAAEPAVYALDLHRDGVTETGII